jgi:hypothetical protein
MRNPLAPLRVKVGRLWKGVALLAVGALAGGAVLAVASVPDSNGTIHACYLTTTSTGDPYISASSPPNVTIIDPSAGQSCAEIKVGGGVNETPLTFNQAGVPGQNGAGGAPGAPGATGPAGAVNTSTLAAKPSAIGNATFTLAHQGALGHNFPNSPTPPQLTLISLALSGAQRHGSLTIGVETSNSALLEDLAHNVVFKSVTIVVNAGTSKLATYTLGEVVATRSQIAGSGIATSQTFKLTYVKLRSQF